MFLLIVFCKLSISLFVFFIGTVTVAFVLCLKIHMCCVFLIVSMFLLLIVYLGEEAAHLFYHLHHLSSKILEMCATFFLLLPDPFFF